MSALQNLPSNINYLSPVGFRFTLQFPDEIISSGVFPLSIGGIDVGNSEEYSNVRDEVSFEELTIQLW